MRASRAAKMQDITIKPVVSKNL